eukprot:5332219-Pyramimonas_sp.AAC.1
MEAQWQSRAQGPQFRAHPARAARSRRDVEIDEHRAHWRVRAHTILSGVARHCRKENGPKQLRQHMHDAEELVGDRPEGIHSILKVNKDAPWGEWIKLLNDCGYRNMAVLESSVDSARRISQRAQRYAVQASVL